MKNMKCTDCGNTEKFVVSVVEYHSWIVDRDGELIRDIGCGDSSKGDDFYCDNCDSFKIEEVK